MKSAKSSPIFFLINENNFFCPSYQRLSMKLTSSFLPSPLISISGFNHAISLKTTSKNIPSQMPDPSTRTDKKSEKKSAYVAPLASLRSGFNKTYPGQKIASIFLYVFKYH